MRFVYEEEAAPEEFFVPYVWTLAVAATDGGLLHWWAAEGGRGWAGDGDGDGGWERVLGEGGGGRAACRMCTGVWS
jgi:hypothetical protein